MRYETEAGWRRPAGPLLMLALLSMAACSTSRPGGSPSSWGQGSYTPPGPSSDPWGPYIQQASSRFSVPEQWIRAVMHQESGGHQYIGGHLVRSGSGAIGLMQLMPATWSQLAATYNLGSDPYEPHDNIMAGTAYIRQMYNRFGSPGFLAAYNAGPGRLEQYLDTGDPLPDETVNYVASISPNLGDALPSVQQPDSIENTAAPVMLASAAPTAVPSPSSSYDTASVSRTADGCLRNVDAAYDPSRCMVDSDAPHSNPPEAPPLEQTALAPPAPHQAVQQNSLPAELASYVEPASASRNGRLSAPIRPAVATLPATLGAGSGPWAIQVGAFSSGAEAKRALQRAQSLIGYGSGRVGSTVTRAALPSNVLYRARLTGFAASDATAACKLLQSHSIACFTVPLTT